VEVEDGRVTFAIHLPDRPAREGIRE
jgi:hypothetical protein